MSSNTCRLHPDAEIAGACERCGDFGCRLCMPGKGTRCLRCGPAWLTLESGSDGAAHAIFDPATEPEVDGITGNRDVDAAPIQGRYVLYAPGGDGSVRFTIVVDEEPPPEWRANAHDPVRGALLRVPSGKLVAAGVEYVGEAIAAEKGTNERPSGYLEGMTSAMQIPPGNYSVDAFETDEEALDDHVHRAEMMRIVVHRFGERAWNASVRRESIPAQGCGVVFVGSLACIVLVFWTNETSWLYGIGAVIAGVVALGYAASRLLSRVPKVEEVTAMRHREQEALSPPQVVLVLKRLPDGADTSSMPSAAFGNYS